MMGKGTPSSRRGSALVLSLIAIVTLAAMGAAFLRITTSLTSRQTDDVENMKAFYLAEAGLAEGFQAVRMGRTGQVGSEAAPATFGDGMLWVQATATANEQVRLESTALVGRGRASLAYVVEPVKVPLGFFGDEELVVESVLLVDGYDSAEGSYGSQLLGEALVLDRADPYLHIDPVAGLVFNNGRFYRFQANEGDTYFYDHAVSVVELSESTWGEDYEIEWDDFVDDNGSDFNDQEYDGVQAYFATVPFAGGSPLGGTSSELGPTTGEGALLGSNGDILFETLPEEDAVIFGDVVPGPNRAIRGQGALQVTGKKQPRPTLVELPKVQVPDLLSVGQVRHEGLLPLLVAAGAVRYERIEVAADAELILQGPSTVVIGTLILEPGATLSLDTRDGDVALYVTAEMDLQPGSVVTTSEDPTEATIQVPEIATGLDGPPVRLDATAQFHGSIYAPATEVRIGGDFEVFGGVIARRLQIGSGARLHFDNAGFEDSPIPRIVSWKIVEVPSAVRGARDPFDRLGLNADDLDPLAECHDLASVEMVVTYLDQAGSLRTFEGCEELFDWDLVSQVVEVDRDPDRKIDPDEDFDEDFDEDADEDADEDLEEELPPEPVRAVIQEAIDTLGGRALKDALQAHTPLNETELLAVLAAMSMGDTHTKTILQASSPVSQKVALRLVQEPTRVDSSGIKDILLAASPLRPAVVDAVRAAPDTKLSASDKDAILQANQ